MSTEDDLRELTNKGGLDLKRRVFITLTDDQKVTKSIAWLVNHLHERGILSIDDVDQMLLDGVGPRTF